MSEPTGEHGRYPDVPIARLRRALNVCSVVLVAWFICLLGTAFLSHSAWGYATALIGCLLVLLTVEGSRIADEIERRLAQSGGTGQSQERTNP